MVGERGPELRYESRGGFIAHNNALRGLVDLSARARRMAATAVGAQPASVGGPGLGGGLDAALLRAAVRAELASASRRARADLRGMLHD